MKILCGNEIVLFFVVMSVSINLTIAQSSDYFTKQQIDTILNLQIQDTSQVDTLWQLSGYAERYKKLLGFIKIRIGTGSSNTFDIISNNKLHLHSHFFKKVTRKKYETFLYEYFYIDNKLHKYVKTEYWEDRSDNIQNLRHKIVYYLNDGIVIDKVLDIRDNYNYSKINMKKVVEQSIAINKEIIEIIKSNS